MLPIDTPPRSYVARNVFGPFVEHDLGEDVDDLTYNILDVTGPRQVELARHLLNLNPESMEALVVLAGHAASPSERLILLREAVRIGQHVWQPAIEEGGIDWWTHAGTRTYMRAIADLGRTLAAQGCWDEAKECVRALLEMNPNDPLKAKTIVTPMPERGAAPSF